MLSFIVILRKITNLGVKSALSPVKPQTQRRLGKDSFQPRWSTWWIQPSLTTSDTSGAFRYLCFQLWSHSTQFWNRKRVSGRYVLCKAFSMIVNGAWWVWWKNGSYILGEGIASHKSETKVKFMPQAVPGWASLLIFLLVLFLIGVMEGIQVVDQ